VSVNDCLRDVQLAMLRKAELEDDHKKVKGILAAHTAELKRLLEAGNTTGDRLRDLVIRSDGVDEESLSLYRGLENRLKGRAGEFVLIRYPAEIRIRFGGDSRSSDYNHEIHFRIGILTGEVLQTINPRLGGGPVIALPVQRFLVGPWPQSFAWRVVAESHVFEVEDFFDWSTPEGQPPQLIRYLKEERFVGDLLIGDDAIKRALAEVLSGDFFAQAAERLGRLVLQPT
jgi:hypothetical protein